MPRREGEVFRFGTAIEISPENGARASWPVARNPFRRRAYRGSIPPRLARTRIDPAQRRMHSAAADLAARAS